MAGEEPTGALAAFAAGLDWDAVPASARAATRLLLLDALACALAGHQGEETGQIAALAAALGHAEDTSVIGGGRMSRAGATVLNGFLVTAVTMCDTHRPTLTHVMPEVLPAAFAIAERDGASGRDLLAAIAAGAEVTTRIGLGLDYAVFRARGWHGPGVLGPFGAAAAAGRLLRFDARTMARAFGLAGSQSAGTFAAWGTPTVKFHQCRGALSGLMAALLAREGFVANERFLSAPDGGLFTTYAAGGRPDLALAGLGARWELEAISLRPWPAASNIQGAVTALADLVETEPVAPAAVRAVRLAIGTVPFEMHGGFARYRGKFEALLSVHYAAAALLHDRALTLAQFEPARYDDPALRRFAAETVTVRHDPALAGVETIAEIVLADGRTLTRRIVHPRGAPDNPLDAGQVEAKFRAYAAARLPPARIDAVVEAVAGLERIASARTLIDLLRA